MREPLGCWDERLGIEVDLAHCGSHGPQPHVKPELWGTPGALTLAAEDFAGLPAGFRAFQPSLHSTAGWRSPCREARDQELGTGSLRDPVLSPAPFLSVYLGSGGRIPLAGDKQN